MFYAVNCWIFFFYKSWHCRFVYENSESLYFRPSCMLLAMAVKHMTYSHAANMPWYRAHLCYSSAVIQPRNSYQYGLIGSHKMEPWCWCYYFCISCYKKVFWRLFMCRNHFFNNKTMTSVENTGGRDITFFRHVGRGSKALKYWNPLLI